MIEKRKTSRTAKSKAVSRNPSKTGENGGAVQSLKGDLLLASPHIDDSRFAKSVILMCYHDRDSSMGLVINRFSRKLKFGDICEKLEIDPPRTNADLRVHIGGPLQGNRGFVLHTQDQMLPDSKPITDDIGLTVSIDILRAINKGAGPAQSIISLGCAGWSAGQLEDELAQNVWLNIPASVSMVFEHDRDTLWQKGFEVLGIEPGYFSDATGSA